MSVQKTVLLIQDVSDFYAYFEPSFRAICHPYFLDGLILSEKTILLWLICHELELSKGLYAVGHPRNKFPELAIYDQLSVVVPFSKVFSFYLKVPIVYDDNNEVKVEINGPDLYIRYFTNNIAQFTG